MQTARPVEGASGADTFRDERSYRRRRAPSIISMLAAESLVASAERTLAAVEQRAVFVANRARQTRISIAISGHADLRADELHALDHAIRAARREVIKARHNVVKARRTLKRTADRIERLAAERVKRLRKLRSVAR